MLNLFLEKTKTNRIWRRVYLKVKYVKFIQFDSNILNMNVIIMKIKSMLSLKRGGGREEGIRTSAHICVSCRASMWLALNNS